MSKFIKRIKKNFKNPRNILVIGDGFGYLEELCENFSTVFIVDVDKKSCLKRKNLVYRENIDSIEGLPELDVVFLNIDQENQVTRLIPLLNRFHPVMFVEGDKIFSKPNYKLLKNYRYSMVEIFGEYHLWKFDQ